MSSPGHRVRAGKSRPGATSTAIAAQAGQTYVQALQRAGNPLVGSEGLASRRRQRAEQIVGDVLEDLGYQSSHRPVQDPWSSLHELRTGGVSLTAAIDASDTLFTVAFELLLNTVPDNPVVIASTLSRRLSQDVRTVAGVLVVTNALELATTEVVDHERLREMLSPQQAAVFHLKHGRATTGQIASVLGISPKTVKNHVTGISRRLDLNGGARSWNAIQHRARELRLLILVPAVAAATYVADAAGTISSLL